ncbi:MAG: Crp/Fnr family transcriptional regulator, partial [Treponema sp.]|nr:Crp/Fnr family transcriptional regulator [Treponema sp.]
LTLEEPQAKVADVFLMLDEIQLNIDKTTERREFSTTVDDIAHWAGMSVKDTNETLRQFVAQQRMEMYPGKIVVKNINDFLRFVNSRRRK